MKTFIKTKWKYIVVAVVALMIGAAGGPSQEELEKALYKIDNLEEKLNTKTETVVKLESDNETLEAKVEEAKPWFELSQQEKENQIKEAELKAAELEKQKKAEEEAAAKAKAEEEEAAAKAKAEEAAAALAAKAKTFSAGSYVVGRDIEPGLYDAKATKGQGNFFVKGGPIGLKVNEMFGVGGGFYNDSFNNLDLEEGDVIEINNDLAISFNPKQ